MLCISLKHRLATGNSDKLNSLNMISEQDLISIAEPSLIFFSCAMAAQSEPLCIKSYNFSKLIIF